MVPVVEAEDAPRGRARQCISGASELEAALWLDRGTDASWTNLSLLPQWL